ncbi:MAG: 30S ribosomal protein S16 [bacterium]|nr:30S ribosomal protein S16 [bacterium]
MLMLRFQRIGRRNDPAFRIVATEKRSKPKSGFLEILGSYHPKTKDTQLKQERILYWLSKGAKASETVHNLLVSKGVIQGKKVAIKMNKAVIKDVEVAKETKDTNATKEIEATKETKETMDVVKDTNVAKEPEAVKEPEVVKEEAVSTEEEKKEEPVAA